MHPTGKLTNASLFAMQIHTMTLDSVTQNKQKPHLTSENPESGIRFNSEETTKSIIPSRSEEKLLFLN